MQLRLLKCRSLEAKDDDGSGVRGGGLSPAVRAGGEPFPARQPKDDKPSSSSSTHAAPPGLALDSGSGGSKPVDKSVHGVSFIDKVGILNSIPPSAPPGAIREFQLFKCFDQQIGCGPSSCNTLRAMEKAQVTKDLSIAVQAGNVGGLHASLLSGTDDTPAAPVFAPRFLLALQLLMHPLLLNGPAMPVISTIQSPTVRNAVKR